MMKKALIFAFTLIVISGFSQTDKTWSFGLQCGLYGNSSEFSGGSEIADGSFHNNGFGSGSFGGTARYDHDSRWMFMTGFGFLSYGFEFSRNAGSYSLKNGEEGQYNTVTHEFGAIEIPAMAFYKFRLNCRNARWLIGAGFARVLAGQAQSTQTISEDTEGNTSLKPYLKSEANGVGGAFTMLRLAFNRERIMKSGSIVQAGIWLNWGFKPLAEASVEYSAGGEDFNHTFTNKGNFFGIRVSYFFRTRKINN